MCITFLNDFSLSHTHIHTPKFGGDEGIHDTQSPSGEDKGLRQRRPNIHPYIKTKIHTYLRPLRSLEETKECMTQNFSFRGDEGLCLKRSYINTYIPMYVSSEV